MPFRPKRSDTQSLSPGTNLDAIKASASGAPDAGPDVKEGGHVAAGSEHGGKETANGHAS